MNRAMGGWRFPGELFEDAIELRERLETDCECNLADPKIDIFQKPPRRLESNPRNVINELASGYLFKLFAQMGNIDSNRLGDFAEGKVLG